MASPFPQTVVIDQARDWYLTVTWTDNNGAPINLTGYTASFGMAQGATGSIALSLASGSGITLGGALGTISLHATATQTNIPAGNYTAELVLDNGGIKTSLLKGNIPVSPKVV